MYITLNKKTMDIQLVLYKINLLTSIPGGGGIATVACCMGITCNCVGCDIPLKLVTTAIEKKKTLSQ